MTPESPRKQLPKKRWNAFSKAELRELRNALEVSEASGDDLDQATANRLYEEIDVLVRARREESA